MQYTKKVDEVLKAESFTAAAEYIDMKFKHAPVVDKQLAFNAFAAGFYCGRSSEVPTDNCCDQDDDGA